MLNYQRVIYTPIMMGKWGMNRMGLDEYIQPLQVENYHLVMTNIAIENHNF